MEIESGKPLQPELNPIQQWIHDLKSSETARYKFIFVTVILLLLLFFALGMSYGAERSDNLADPSDTSAIYRMNMPCLLVQTLHCGTEGVAPEKSIIFKLRFPTMEPSVGGAGGTVSLYTNIQFPENFFRGSLIAPPYRSRNQIFLSIGDALIVINQNDPIQAEYNAKLSLQSGTLTHYPFDEYELQLKIIVAVHPNYDGTNNTHWGFPKGIEVSFADQPTQLTTMAGTLNPNAIVRPPAGDMQTLLPDFNSTAFLAMPFVINLTDTTAGAFEVDTYVVTPKVFSYSDLGHFKIKFARPHVTKFYPMCVIIGMWGILVAELFVLYWMVVLRFKKTDNPAMLGFFAAVIFALPSLRNSMPFNPPLGILIDFASFFWAEVVAMSALLLISIRFAIDTSPYVNVNPAPAPPK
eukprot:TRINITY_DN3979_c0_g5_i1.p1 TRINITY_DN3979_c0_g5~~TRINITY_DN3979_c0_g5_i1.p1  ORF type:complete len:432 (-),score=75.98 TRINITY_DN3979_c0_g5_i1:128-1354(-)